MHKHNISRFCTPISSRISTFTVRLLEPGDLKVEYPIITFFEKKKKQQFFFYANGPKTFKVQLYKVQLLKTLKPFEITWPLSKQPFHEHASSRIVKLIFIINNDYMVYLRTSWV